MKSLDPRVNRLQPMSTDQTIVPKAALDQFGTFEVFVQPKEGKPFQHEGIVHAPDLELAYVLAKEAFTRRFTCTSLYVADTRDVYTSPTTEGNQTVYSLIEEPQTTNAPKTSYEIYHLLKRGKQHLHAGTVEAATPQEAIYSAQQKYGADKIVYNVWAIRTDAIRFTTPEEKDLWNTLPEKKFRDATDYKGGDKLKSYLERSS